MLADIFLSALIASVILLAASRINLQKKYRLLQDKEKAIQSYMADAFHELKTPLTAVKVLADSLLEQNGAGIEVYREFMSDISAEIDREARIIDDLMSLTGLERKPDISEFSVNILTEDIVRLFAPAAREKKITISLDDCEPLKVCTDKKRLSDIIMNLVENAVKYNIESGWIKVSVYSEQDWCCIRVADSGIGIPQEEQKRVFERFYRVDKQHSREIGGTGLGLSIVLESAGLLGGSVSLQSKEHTGSIFTVKIPININKNNIDEKKYK